MSEPRPVLEHLCPKHPEPRWEHCAGRPGGAHCCVLDHIRVEEDWQTREVTVASNETALPAPTPRANLPAEGNPSGAEPQSVTTEEKRQAPSAGVPP